MALNVGDFIQSSISSEAYEVKQFIAAGGFGSAYLVTRISDNMDLIG